jgi:hypothetical protein
VPSRRSTDFSEGTPILQIQDVLAAIIQVDLRRWDGPAIARKNPGIRLHKGRN